MYDGYWKSRDRWGEHSFENPDAVVDGILETCRLGRVLDVGCGMGALVRTMLRRGVDAYGLDVAPVVVDHGNRACPDRFFLGSVLELPFPDAHFDTIVSTDCFEHLSEADVPAAIAELYRVCRAHVFVTLSTHPDRDGRWHLTVRNRTWWEQRFFEGGFRKHPLGMRVTPYEELEREGWQIILLMEKIPEPAAACYPVSSLVPERDLHNDMLRETGRRSDAHIVRYVLAASYLRDGDTVVDAACGLGYGSAILSASNPSVSVTGVDNSEFAIHYAQACYRGRPERMGFVCADLASLASFVDNSVDLVVSFETLEHLHDPGRFLEEARRVLRPSGRIIVSVPNQWTDEHGNDPNPHHFHVYDWRRLHREMSALFMVEAAYAQIAGGGMKLTDSTRRLHLVEAGPDDPGAPAEWWLFVGMKDPLLGREVPYSETSLPAYPEPGRYNVIAWGRDYRNPWLVKGMVSIGWRHTNPGGLEDVAARTLETAPPGSPDAGAAVCVLAYGSLDRIDNLDAASAHRCIERIDRFLGEAEDSPNALRWVVSNLYVKGLLLLSTGERERALEAFLDCAGRDIIAYSPVLATKTVGAYYFAGLLHGQNGDIAAARTCWSRGMEESRRVLQGNWSEIWGEVDNPIWFGVPEITLLLDITTRCSDGLVHLSTCGQSPWDYGSPPDRSFARRLGKRAGERERDHWKRVAEEREQLIRLTLLPRIVRAIRRRLFKASR
ncbi:MAG: methyltransferase domain-containing protein [Pseudomonadota bacterium]